MKYNSNKDSLRITFADVGQGDCSIIEAGNHSIMIDCGTESQNASYNSQMILSLMRTRGIEKFDIIAITHFHSDHSNIIPHLLDAGKTKKLLISRYWNFHEGEALETKNEILESATKNHIPVEYIGEGTFVEFPNGARIDVLSPSHDMFFENNDMSAVIKLTYGKNSFLFCGDIENDGIANLSDKDIECDVLKIPHHGGYCEKADNFIRRTTCKHAIISCSEGNSYGHPDKRILSTLESIGANAYRTDVNGAITLVASKDRIEKVTTMK